jgi:Papain-like cysteine protease AvrRpt2
MNRRLFTQGLGVTMATLSSFPAAAQCTPLFGNALGCTLKLDSHFHVVVQNCASRCWAASISAIFGYHDHALDQDVIAQTVFGTTDCKPAGSSGVLDKVLNHTWTDDDGDTFNATITGLYDPSNGIRTIDNDDVVSELVADRPLLYCNQTHAMVQVGMKYRKDRSGNLIAVDEVTVADPWPNKGIHTLSMGELMPVSAGGQMTYLASVNVTDN